MTRLFLIISNIILLLSLTPLSSSEIDVITPYKFTDEERSTLSYEAPASSRFTTRRSGDAPDIVYYFSQPNPNDYPIVIMCGGSSDKNNIESIIHTHRYFLQEWLDMGIGVITLEQWGVDGNKVNTKEFIGHYTRSQRLEDHKIAIEHLKLNPPIGWNGKFIFWGVSEGGPLVIKLTEEYPDITIATINWSGTGDWSWKEELWVFLQQLLIDCPECGHGVLLRDCTICSQEFPSRDVYDNYMRDILQNPTTDQEFFNMTNKYHADALLYPSPNYQKIRTPFLVVTGVKDSLIHSSDAFVQKAIEAGVDITYLRVPDMDHYVRKRPDVIEQSFNWLRTLLKRMKAEG